MRLFHQSFAPNSPDLNPVDYIIWGEMQQRIYQTKVYDVNELKHRLRLIDVWHGFEQIVIDDAVDEWRNRLRECISVKGGDFNVWLHVIGLR